MPKTCFAFTDPDKKGVMEASERQDVDALNSVDVSLQRFSDSPSRAHARQLALHEEVHDFEEYAERCLARAVHPRRDLALGDMQISGECVSTTDCLRGPQESTYVNRLRSRHGFAFPMEPLA